MLFIVSDMPQQTITVTGLGKRYQLGSQRSRYETLGETITRLVRFRRPPSATAFWALRGISFDVQPGQAVGLIGSNGAGKSTLLKILARITSPTEGQAVLRGRVAALLEVGSGFHPELTGRENIYLNAALLGMSRWDVKARFDAIVAFAGVEEFLDTPVKRYSTGMYVRLGFSVAAHLEAETLLVDEVLAVGDASFQQRCLSSMRNAVTGGRTVVLVSHNLPAIQGLCDRVLVLSKGQLTWDGAVEGGIREYLHSSRTREKDAAGKPANAGAANGPVSLESIELLDPKTGAVVESVSSGGGLTIALSFRAEGRPRNVSCAIDFRTAEGQRVAYCNSFYTSGSYYDALAETGIIRCEVQDLPFGPGDYRLDVAFHSDGERSDYVPNAAVFSVPSFDYYGSGKLPPDHVNAPVLLRHAWEMRSAEEGARDAAGVSWG